MTKDETLATLKGLTDLARGLIYPRAEAFEVDHQPGLGGIAFNSGGETL